ncbi:uncharacterized protein LOC128678862 isoform X2 [Plodia interpunctella]|uniref:uncharacterized protein LOC128678862 isoform X2 n=1 Tax=Plodia interpunctella TaxID=58824 RepID=UPI002367C4BF|nr:uncharacterized protein LOC128678862 isoform X2 [Plodia interpunctella]XP_053616703.1 uncharacterized protein LOC128678862 isoform X2 [Plodia interpunctella]XP_053616704.1 uncharacterized protein LOC128678862 isoform X2 [Plodia interpunctella]
MSHSWKRKLSWFWAELVAAVRRRGRGDGSDDDEDLGLPRSPPASPPTDKADKRHHAGISQSSCSDGSLLSVGSSEMDEDSSSGHHHSHDHSNRSDHSDIYNTSEPPTGVAPLSHSAAKHKMAVRPRRTHGAPRRKKNNPIVASALPITPELNEEMIRSTTPEVAHKTSEVVTESLSSSTTTKHMIVKEQHLLVNRELQRVLETPSDTKLKSSSLPPGLALSQLMGQSPAKLSIVEVDTPRSSIKRSKSSSQGQSLRDSSPKPQVTTSSENQITTYHSEERMNKYRTDKKAEESCLEKKSKSEKKIENEVIRKKEESFFSRLLLRKSGKKSKKDATDTDGQQDIKKSKTEKATAQYKVVDNERSGFHVDGQGYKPTPAERTHKSAGQKAFANQMHKRLDNKGGYVQDSAYKDVYSAAKVPGVEYNITDLKVAEETDKMLNLEMKSRFSRRDEFSEKVDRAKRTSSKEAIDVLKDSGKMPEKSKRPTSMQRDPFSSKTFLNNEVANRVKEDILLPAISPMENDASTKALKIKSANHDYTFHSGSMPKNIPYFSPGIGISSCSPPKTSKHTSAENIKHRSSEHVSNFNDKTDGKRESIKRPSNTEDAFVRSEMRSLGDEYVETRSSIGKSHSFRYASETTSISSQDNQMPSLPAIVGISEPLLQSWEVNYRRNVTERHDYSQRISARNYNILHTTADGNYDSLPSTDSSYLDSLKTDVNEDRKLFTNSIHITMDSHKRDSDISQIEAKIDDIISSPKPIISPILKSSSLDSVKSSPEKPIEDRRKTISVESALSQSSKLNTQREKLDADGFISVTHINNDQTPMKVNETTRAINKSDEKIQKSGIKPGVPEFLNIQLNKVDTKPITNIVLTANVTPKKIDSPQADKELDIESFQITETKVTQSIPVKKESVKKILENAIDAVHSEDKVSPAVSRKSVQSNIPQSPSTPKAFFKRKAASVELQDRPEKPRTNSMSTDGSTERIYDNISMDQKSHSSFGSKSSIQSIDSNDVKAPDRHEEAVVYRRKPVMLPKDIRNSSDRKNDDEPELMKVFARRSLKLKDSEADSLAQDIADTNKVKDEIDENLNATRTKIHKNEFNASIKSRDSDKENEDASLKEQAEEKRLVDIAARVSQFGVPHYQRSISINSVSNPKRESAPVCRNEVNKYKKEVSDSTPEKRLRNRTFPDPSNDRDDIKNIAKSEAMAYKADTLTKRPWQRKDDDKLRRLSVEKEKRESAVIEKDVDTEKDEGVKEKDGADGEADASPQFKGILQMRAEWERRAKQGMTK